MSVTLSPISVHSERKIRSQVKFTAKIRISNMKIKYH